MSSGEESVPAMAEEQTRGREGARSQTRRGKSRAPARETLETRVSGLEKELAVATSTIGELSDQVDNLIHENAEITKAAKSMIEELGNAFRGELRSLSQEFSVLRNSLQEEVHHLRREVETFRRGSPTSAGPSTATSSAAHPSLKVPKPAMFNGTRNATLVENFLFGLEQYFEAKSVSEDVSRISNAAIFLRDAAQLWWRRKHADRERGLCVINTWEQFKAELRKQFVPSNAGEEVLSKLRRLRQTGTISEYVKEFTTLMLEVNDVSDQQLLFDFKDGLKDWAKLELNRRGVQTLDEAIAAVENLKDYSAQEKGKDPSSPKSGGAETRNFKGKEVNHQKPSNGNSKFEKNSPKSKVAASKPPSPCYICDGPHWTRDCPNRKAMNALVAEYLKDKTQEEPQAEMGSLQHLSALSKLPSPSVPKEKGLLYVDAIIKGKSICPMIDTGATHNYLDVQEAKRLGLRLSKGSGIVKSVNSEAKEVHGIAKSVKVQVGDWQGKLDFTVVPIDDFKVVLGLAFFHKASAIPIPATSSLIILNASKLQVIPLKSMAKSKPAVILPCNSYGTIRTRSAIL